MPMARQRSAVMQAMALEKAVWARAAAAVVEKASQRVIQLTLFDDREKTGRDKPPIGGLAKNGVIAAVSPPIAPR